MKKLILITIILLLFVPCIFPQDLNNVYSPYGFQAPFLKSGEFILTARGYYSWGDYEYFYEDEPDRYSNSENSNYYMYARGVLALTDKFLINSTLYIYPGMETSRSFYGNSSYDQVNWFTRKTYLYPNFSLIFRPVRNLEIAGSYSHRSYDQAYDRIYNDEEFHNYDSTSKYTYTNISINYFGKLWGK